MLKPGLRALGAGLLLLSIPGFPQESRPLRPAPDATPRAVALIVPRPGGEQHAAFQKVLTAALGIELARAGLAARIPEEALLAALAAAPLERLLKEATDADFLFLERYTSTEETIHLEVEVWRVKGGERIASASASRRIDLRLDEVVGPVVEELLPQIRPHLAEAVQERQRLAEAQVPPAEAPEAPAAQASQEQAEPEPLPAGQERPDRASPAGLAPERRLEIGAGGGTFFPMAELGPLFRFGYLAELYLEHRSHLGSAALAYGVYTGYAGLLPAEQDTASYFGSLIPVGLSLRLGTSERSRLGMHVRIQAGAALNASPQDKVVQRLTRVLPQAKAGAGLSLALAPRLGLSLDFLYELLLYMYMQNGTLVVEPIMGFNVPVLFFYIRL
ncbi:MAG: hypothetical protein A2V99_03285 [Spirochaetes bacterium RBG_16_67_19]|nr:MAG: hypothetical protein A2V99_03285 [Spirochaetes bacterium RBG_16_67_19]